MKRQECVGDQSAFHDHHGNAFCCGLQNVPSLPTMPFSRVSSMCPCGPVMWLRGLWDEVGFEWLLFFLHVSLKLCWEVPRAFP